MTSSEDPDIMPHYAAFHHGPHCLCGQNQSLEERNTF